MISPKKMMNETPGNGKVYDFLEYRRNKPFFTMPMKIYLGSPIYGSYQIINNKVYQGKQILAINKEEDHNNILLVEATIKEGKLSGISKLPKHLLKDVIPLFEGPDLEF